MNAGALKNKKNLQKKAKATEEQGNIIMAQAGQKASALECSAVGSLLSGAAGIAGSGVADSWFDSESSALA